MTEQTGAGWKTRCIGSDGQTSETDTIETVKGFFGFRGALSQQATEIRRKCRQRFFATLGWREVSFTTPATGNWRQSIVSDMRERQLVARIGVSWHIPRRESKCVTRVTWLKALGAAEICAIFACKSSVRLGGNELWVVLSGVLVAYE